MFESWGNSGERSIEREAGEDTDDKDEHRACRKFHFIVFFHHLLLDRLQLVLVRSTFAPSHLYAPPQAVSRFRPSRTTMPCPPRRFLSSACTASCFSRSRVGHTQPATAHHTRAHVHTCTRV